MGKIFRPEFELLAECARVSTASGGRGRLEAASIDWDLALRLARRHRVEGQLASCLLQKNIDGIPALPPVVARELQAARQSIAIAEMRLLSGLKLIKDSLDAAGIEPTLLKGLHTTSRAYGRLGVRTNHDIDLLVDEAEVAEAAECLVRLGFEERSGEYLGLAKLSAETFKARKDLEFYSPKLDILVDLHWRLFSNPFLLPVTDISQTRIETLLGNSAVRVLRPEANIVYLAVHGAHHGWSRLKWLADFQAIIAAEGPQALAAARQLAGKLRLTACLNQALFLQGLIFHNDQGDDVRQRSRSGLRARILSKLALISMIHYADSEIEAVWGGTKPKNISHYLLKNELRYLSRELAQDFRGRVAELLHRRRAHYVSPLLAPSP